MDAELIERFRKYAQNSSDPVLMFQLARHLVQLQRRLDSYDQAAAKIIEQFDSRDAA
ncbi:hypothetical protein [Arthrobacter sp. MDT1-65]